QRPRASVHRQACLVLVAPVLDAIGDLERIDDAPTYDADDQATRADGQEGGAPCIDGRHAAMGSDVRAQRQWCGANTCLRSGDVVSTHAATRSVVVDSRFDSNG